LSVAEHVQFHFAPLSIAVVIRQDHSQFVGSA